VQVSALHPPRFVGLHLLAPALVDQAQAPAEEITRVAPPGLLQQQGLGVAGVPPPGVTSSKEPT
jgi:hypothetical protein